MCALFQILRFAAEYNNIISRKFIPKYQFTKLTSFLLLEKALKQYKVVVLGMYLFQPIMFLKKQQEIDSRLIKRVLTGLKFVVLKQTLCCKYKQ